MFMINKPLIAENLECHRKDKGLEAFRPRRGFTGGRGQEYHRWRLDPAPPWPILRQRSKKDFKETTFEAGMSMKKKDHETQCPNKNRHLSLNFRHF
jgi:hypothetical protein